jgi:hypothetical protein
LTEETFTSPDFADHIAEALNGAIRPAGETRRNRAVYSLRRTPER